MAPLRPNWPPPGAKHVIVVGDSGLALRFIKSTTENFGLAVTAVLKPGPGFQRTAIRAAQSRNDLIRVQEAEHIDTETVADAGLKDAYAVVLLAQDDVGNLHLALKIRELSNNLAAREDGHRARLIIRMYNRQLRSRVKHLVGKDDLYIESDADMVAPTYVAAAQLHVPPGKIRLWGRELLVSNRPEGGTEWAIAQGERPHVQILPDEDLANARYLRLLPRSRSPALRRFRKRAGRALRRVLREFRRTVDIKLRLAALALTVILITGIVLLRVYGQNPDQPLTTYDALYIISLAAGGGIDPELRAQPWTRFAHASVTLAGSLLVPVVTGAIVQALVGRKYALATGRIVEPVRRHVIVVGLGNIGTRVVELLRAQGQQVVAIEKDRDVPGVQTARACGAQVLFGDAGSSEVLHEAGVQQCISVVAMAKQDSANLEVALSAISCRPDVHTVLRIYDEEFAELVRQNLNRRFQERRRRRSGPPSRDERFETRRHSSWSAPRVAAAAFAALVTDDQILATIPVRGQMVHIAQIGVEAGSDAVGLTADRLNEPGAYRLVALRRPTIGDNGEVIEPSVKTEHYGDIWYPDREHVIAVGDRLLVLASQAGLAHLERITGSPSD
ncbi:potassium channel protein [Salininema proteolyticum]|uniref:NAD-binding protein n=1 Tax=Salininema proteolyticum TaxID=1607685 RepID=A0ABV8TWT1_9ACTN